MCYRVSAFPLSFDKAVKACESEFATLAHIPDNKTQEALATLILNKRVLYSYFNGKNDFWLGATVVNGPSMDFDWMHYEFPMAFFNKLKSRPTLLWNESETKQKVH
jgi:hypothetical protein